MAADKPLPPDQPQIDAQAAEYFTASGGSGGLHQKIHGRTEEYVYMNRNDLRELKTFGWLHESLIAIGTFFFSGAFWLAAEILSHQEHFTFTASLGMCLVSIFAGSAVAVAGWIIFGVKQKKIDSYFGTTD